jgi:uncharacterized protein YecE (DUF72 family)
MQHVPVDYAPRLRRVDFVAGAKIGTAGWSIASSSAQAFPAEGTSLERYMARFSCAEINSSFHRPHRPATYERWAAAVPEDFRFSVKLAKTITHKQRLVEAEDLLRAFFGEIAGLEAKAAVLLVQLPPSLSFDPEVAESFFAFVRRISEIRVACEPRHASWFSDKADELLRGMEIARVAADPAKVEVAAHPGGWQGFSYYRLHGSPVPYRSSYEPERLEAYAEAIRADLSEEREVWCIFDNTASSAATGNALDLKKLLAGA